MKKNVMMRVASALLVAVLLTTCAISGTFAKYTTSATGSDSARVAKWGFESVGTVAINDLFNYTDSGVKNTDGTVDGLIAPGTTNTRSFAFTYDTASNSVTKPEVKYTFTVSTADSNCVDTIKNNTNIKWYLDDAVAPAYKGTGTDDNPEFKAGTWGALLKAIEALSGDPTGTKTYNPGQLPEAFYGNTPDGAKTHAVKWEWTFDGGSETYDPDNDPGTPALSQDEYDTLMGNADTLASVTLKITVTATQVNS